MLFCQCFHISVKLSRLVRVPLILLATRLNELKTLLANPQKLKQVGCFGFDPRTPHYYTMNSTFVVEAIKKLVVLQENDLSYLQLSIVR